MKPFLLVCVVATAFVVLYKQSINRSYLEGCFSELDIWVLDTRFDISCSVHT